MSYWVPTGPGTDARGSVVCVKLFEYQAKELFEEAGIAVPRGRLASDVFVVDEALEEVGLPCAIKAQVLRGGRGKAGLIQLASTADEARTQAGRILDSTGNERSLLVEQALEIEKEIGRASCRERV